MRAVLWALPVLVGLGGPAHARVFDFKGAGIATYLRGTGGLSSLGQEAFNDASGTSTVLEGESKYQYSGELGLLFPLSNSSKLKLGAELIQHKPVEAKGKNTAGVERFSLESDVVIFNPNLTLEFIYKDLDGLRFFFAAGAGYSDVTVDNRYDMTATGTTDLGVADFDEKLSGTAYSAHAGIGLETLFVDNVTFAADFGYRFLKVQSLKYKGDVKNIVKPSGASQGDEALNHDGNSRALDLGGVYIGVSLRFYLLLL